MATNSEPLTTVISTKGQVILPKAIRDQRRWVAGTRLTVEQTADGVMLRAAPTFVATTMEDVFGMLPYEGPPLSLDDMDAAIAAEAMHRARD